MPKDGCGDGAIGLLLCCTTRSDFLGADILEQDIGRWIVALENDRSLFEPQASPRIGIGFSLVSPVSYLEPVNPDADVRTSGDDGFGKPLLVVGVDVP